MAKHKAHNPVTEENGFARTMCYFSVAVVSTTLKAFSSSIMRGKHDNMQQACNRNRKLSNHVFTTGVKQSELDVGQGFNLSKVTLSGILLLARPYFPNFSKHSHLLGTKFSNA